MRTRIAELAGTTGPSRKRGWFQTVSAWCKGYLGTDMLNSSQVSSEDVLSYYWRQAERSAKGRALGYVNYNSKGFSATRRYLKDALRYPEISRGVNWLTRARVGGIWMAARAAKIGLIHHVDNNQCPSCRSAIYESELLHIVVDCTKFEEQRMKYLNEWDLSEPERAFERILGGANDMAFVQAPEGNGKPKFLDAAIFLQEVMPKYMKDVWGDAEYRR